MFNFITGSLFGIVCVILFAVLLILKLVAQFIWTVLSKIVTCICTKVNWKFGKA
jgi:hypothetical protein